MIILAIDYGMARVGLAISDEYAKMALPYDTIENNGLDFLISKIKEIVKIENVNKIIIGSPKSLQGEDNDSIGLKRFVLQLKKNIELPVELVDERFSSKMADHYKIDKSFKKSGQRDQIAATIILESYLESL